MLDHPFRRVSARAVSTLRDVVSGSPSELLELAGAVSRHGLAASPPVPTPTHDFVLAALIREKEIGGSGGSLEPSGPLLMHLHTVYMPYPECLPTRLNPLAERTRSCVSQALMPQERLARGERRVISDCHFRKTATEDDRKPGMKWSSCTAK